ncbi:nucleolar MIF4G domain-containing protein 1 [Venturia canescens]|uniref:nucleolar MIF4G domain-containing protein 1 n=1 Tax=Venturia canescens TaxID=32260 RepID=UPI001C9D3CD7|nr:nucleolar MIF4G domain-containing protein 1 [Venturia canescens]XP_043276187.1 nucleolar MIF4G domain-containing protein 1 [Venturia canescens]
MKVKRKHGKKKQPVQKTRKEIRKDKRKQKKINRAAYHEQKKKVPGKFVLNPDRAKTPDKTVNKVTIKDDKDELQKKLDREKKKEIQLAKQMERRRKNQLKEANQTEDKIIKQLEKQLKLDKRKSKTTPKSFAADGLDYLLDFCNDENRKLAVETEKQLLGGDADSDFDEDFAMITGSKREERDSDENSDVSESENDDFLDENSSGEEDIEEPEQKKLKKYDNSEIINGKKKLPKMTEQINDELSEEDDDLEDNSSNFNSECDENNSDIPKDEEIGSETEDMSESGNFSKCHNGKKTHINEDGTWEDIYGRKRDRDGNILTANENKYVPPAARLKQLETNSMLSEKLSRLKKQLKGHLNRLAEHNMHTIITQIEDLYMSNSRNDMNEMISKLMMESIVSPVMTPDRLIAEHMMLIAILHANVGTEVGAHFLLSLVRKFDEMIKIPQEVENKELDNIILMISHLYNFKVYGSQLLYQILNILSEKFTEKEIELILLILKSVGFLLRKDDPVALKELILKLQQKASSSKSENSRIKFMLDVVLAIKNNNMSKIPQYDPTHVEHLKKIMKTFLRKGNVVTQFNISLEDLLQVDERGKWWIVGSAWTGNNDLTKPLKSTDNSGKPLFSQKILDLARKQRMNTDTRRNIFCILMTAEDYLDAFEKLHHLGLKDQQAREIIYVIMDCCLQEKKFNPYYAVLAQKFCDYDRKNQMTLQYSIWDKLKELQNYNEKQLSNFAKFLTHLFVEKGLALSVLKVVEFGQLDKQTMRLLRQIILGILLHDTEEACLHVFERISISPQLKTFREGLRLFINHFLIKNAELRTISAKEVDKLKKRGELVDRILLSLGGKTVF